MGGGKERVPPGCLSPGASLRVPLTQAGGIGNWAEYKKKPC